MASYLDFEGMYDQSARYIFYNWSSEDFVQHFGAESVYNDVNVVETHPAYDLRIKAGEMRELGQFEALICTKHFVNREMLRDASKLEGRERERVEMATDNKDNRKPFEDKTLSRVESGKESSFMSDFREKIRAEELAKIKTETKETKEIVDSNKPFCEYCESKGVTHRKNCTRPKVTKEPVTEFAGV